MPSIDTVIAGGGVSGLLIASALASECSVLLIEQSNSIPENKYWLTNKLVASENPHLENCIDRYYDSIDFIAYDGLVATVAGSYCLWDTEQLVSKLTAEILSRGGQIWTGHRLYSLSNTRNGIVIRANSKAIHAKLLIDCMGFGSPIVGAKNVATVKGYYILHGREIGLIEDVRPTALDNVVINRAPAYFELFPTSKGTAHAALIVPSRHYKTDRSLKAEFSFILSKSHYCEKLLSEPTDKYRPYFGIIPVGRLHTPVLDRIVFFGEAGQANPAASATGLTRMLRTYRDLAGGLMHCLKNDDLKRGQLLRAVPPYMSRMNRLFQESLFESLLTFSSDDFRRLVLELKYYPQEVINDLIFGEFDFTTAKTLRLALDALFRSGGVLGNHVMRSIARFCMSRR